MRSLIWVENSTPAESSGGLWDGCGKATRRYFSLRFTGRIRRRCWVAAWTQNQGPEGLNLFILLEVSCLGFRDSLAHIKISLNFCVSKLRRRTILRILRFLKFQVSPGDSFWRVQDIHRGWWSADLQQSRFLRDAYGKKAIMNSLNHS